MRKYQTSMAGALCAAMLFGGATVAGAQSQSVPAQDSLAQDSSAQDVLVVTGRTPMEREVRSAVNGIVPHTYDDESYPRLYGPVCFRVAGLDRKLGIEILDRMSRKAQQAGIPLAPDSCQPNIFVIFTNDPAADIDNLARHHPEFVLDVPDDTIKKLVHSEGPAYSWNILEAKSRDGDSAHLDPGSNMVVRRQPQPSRITIESRIDLNAAVLMIRRQALVGKTTMQIADYAAMRTLAGVKDNVTTNLPTILTLFKPGATTPAEMTRFDNAYLSTVYSAPATARSKQTISEIVRRIADPARD